jgi:hypothetical protein
MRPTDETQVLSEAALRLQAWTLSVVRQADRILMQFEDELKRFPFDHDIERAFARQADGHLLGISLIQVRAMADVCSRQVDGDSRDKIESALREFNTALPNLKQLRNIVAHQDEYLEGRGRLQKDSDNPELSGSVGADVGRNGSLTEYTVSITIAPGLPTVRLPIVAGAAAAHALSTATLPVVWRWLAQHRGQT